MYANLAFKAVPTLVLQLQLLSLLSKTSGQLITNTTEKSRWKEFALGITFAPTALRERLILLRQLRPPPRLGKRLEEPIFVKF